MSIFFQTLSNIFTAFKLLITGNEKAISHIQTTQAHWLLSWLMMLIASLIYMLYLPSAFINEVNMEILPESADYSTFKFANMLSLIFVLLAGYLIVYLFAKSLEYAGSIRRYIIAQNWLFLITIVVLLPVSKVIVTEENPFIAIMVFVFIFLLFLSFRSLKIILGISGLKAFMLLLVLLVFELGTDRVINEQFGLINSAAS